MHSEHFPDSFHRVSVKGVCVIGGKVLLVKEPIDVSGKWELPGGGLDFGEIPQIGLKREVEEEMKLVVIFVSDQPIYAWTDRYENRRGMDWYYSLVLCYKIEFADLDFTPTSECEDIGFFTTEELQKLDIFHQSENLRDVFDPLDFK